ncbi:TRAP transporter substrate-binding protein DctP [Sporosarcina sp. P19]|uniref:TRAP transporter substrate-binding protein DctP n=1 Tax=Sporosarcina sp. P19 TaxID=2048258 RepID=UPI000C1729D7|nr:TRAP transporter substrate-binding protein DctP [Sporosarcina sp. P19]PIC78028.1 TRAP transporter substrate-binding protein DctP [Sporosarcina sp. P19]
MKSKMFLVIIGFALLLLTACGEDSEKAANSNDGETYKLRVTSALSANHGLWVGFYEPWMKKVEEDSDGRVTFETFTSEELVKATNEVEALKQGTVNIAAPLLPIYEPSTFPLSEVSMLPLTKSSPIIGSLAFKELINSDVELQDGKTFAELEYGAQSLKVLPATISEEYSISTTGLKFDSVKDVQKAKLRTPSRIHEIYAKKIGTNSVTMPTFDLYDAMSRGAVDGSFLFISDWTGYGFEELFKYTVNDINLGHFSSLLAMTEKQWDEFPEDIQKIMIDASDELVENGAELWVDRSEEIIANSKEQGGEFVSLNDLDPEVKELLIEGMEDTWTDFIELLNKQGDPGTEIAKLWRDIVIEQGGDVPEAVKDL